METDESGKVLDSTILKFGFKVGTPLKNYKKCKAGDENPHKDIIYEITQIDAHDVTITLAEETGKGTGKGKKGKTGKATAPADLAPVTISRLELITEWKVFVKETINVPMNISNTQILF